MDLRDPGFSLLQRFDTGMHGMRTQYQAIIMWDSRAQYEFYVRLGFKFQRGTRRPEGHHPFPAALRDLEACCRGLVDKGITRIALTGDSAGGDLALVLLSIVSRQASKDAIGPVGPLVFSPITDLALTGESFETRAEADPLFTKAQAAGLIQSYLSTTDPKNPLASPLYADLSRLPPIRVHVGDDEVLLDDSRRYVERAVAAGVDAKLDVWMGMPHGFVANVRGFNAVREALKTSGAFLSERLKSAAK
jgi:epsilon-lactone hydrolase